MSGGPRRLALLGTGSLTVAHLPFWVNWLRAEAPGTEMRVLLTRSAARLVSAHTLTALTGRPVAVDAWSDEPVEVAPHVQLAEWADAWMVHPATVHTVGRLAVAAADTPAMLALQCTGAPIAIAPSFPAGALDNPLVADHLARLGTRPNVVVVPGHAGRSAGTGRRDALVPAPLPEVWGELCRMNAASRECDTAAGPQDRAAQDPVAARAS